MITIAPTRDIATCRAPPQVFIEEQGVSEADEVDDLDDQAIHLLATDNGIPLGSARLLTYAKPARLAVSACWPRRAALALAPP